MPQKKHMLQTTRVSNFLAPHSLVFLRSYSATLSSCQVSTAKVVLKREKPPTATKGVLCTAKKRYTKHTKTLTLKLHTSPTYLKRAKHHSFPKISYGSFLLILSEEGVTRRNVGDTIIVIFLVTRTCLK